jgi:hypothetical protein
MVSTPHQIDLVILSGNSTAICCLQRHPMKQVVPWTRKDAVWDEGEGSIAMNA